MKYKVNDYVEITDRKCGHDFNIGDVVKIIKVSCYDYAARLNGNIYYICDNECKLITKKKIMRKQDLRTGMIIETRDGRIGKVMLNTSNGDIIAGSEDFNTTWFPLNTFNEDLTMGDPNYDIVSVSQCSVHNAYLASMKKGELLWERKKAKKLTVSEISRKLGYNVEVVAEK